MYKVNNHCYTKRTSKRVNDELAGWWTTKRLGKQSISVRLIDKKQQQHTLNQLEISLYVCYTIYMGAGLSSSSSFKDLFSIKILAPIFGSNLFLLSTKVEKPSTACSAIAEKKETKKNRLMKTQPALNSVKHRHSSTTTTANNQTKRALFTPSSAECSDRHC